MKLSKARNDIANRVTISIMLFLVFLIVGTTIKNIWFTFFAGMFLVVIIDSCKVLGATE